MGAFRTDEGDLRHSPERLLVSGSFAFPQTSLIGQMPGIWLPGGCFSLVANLLWWCTWEFSPGNNCGLPLIHVLFKVFDITSWC
jgi:hypothetical protein